MIESTFKWTIHLARNEKKALSLLQILDGINFAHAIMYVTPYRISWITFTLDLVLWYDDNLLCSSCNQFVIILLQKKFQNIFLMIISLMSLKKTCRYLDKILIIDNPYFEGMVNQIYPPELRLHNANA